jgi:hypothetical protein
MGVKDMSTNQDHQTTLPIRRNLNPIYIGSVLIVVLMAIASTAGILFRSSIYPTEELTRTFVPNEVVNLIIGLPFLLGSMGLARRGQMIGLLCWPGGLS